MFFLMLIWFGYLRFLDFYGLLYFTNLEKIYYLKDLLSFLLPSSIPSTCRLLIWNSFKFLNGSSDFPCSGCVLFISLNMLGKFTVSSPVLPWLCLVQSTNELSQYIFFYFCCSVFWNKDLFLEFPFNYKRQGCPFPRRKRALSLERACV